MVYFCSLALIIMTQFLANGLSFTKGTGLRVLIVAGAALLLIWLLRLLTSQMVHHADTQGKGDAAREEQARTIADVLFSAGAVIVIIAAIWVMFPSFGLPQNAAALEVRVAFIAVRVLFIAIGAFLLNRLLRAYTAHMIVVARTDTRASRAREEQTRTVASALYSAATAVIILGAILMILPEFGFHETPVAAAAGLLSLALGFGGQYLVRDVINGFFIIFEDQYSVGDTIKLNSETGRVEHMTLRRTVLRNAQGALVTIPNGQVGQVANLSRDWSQHFLDVTIPSEEKIQEALALLDKCASEVREDPSWAPLLVDGPRVLGVESLALTGTTLRVQFKSAPNRNDEVARELRRRILLEMDRAGVKLVGAHRVTLLGPEPNPATTPRHSGKT
ncbi:MAG TPA: mechanosensitive ion channel family protein [Candidatus Acidoferrales bacterium]|nr:mechanosensitive ion channel family protein [Candidatus Acidoferrales bacterium]